MIVQTETATGPAFQVEAKGVAYHAQMIGGRWCVLSRRLALGRSHFGTSRWFDTVAEIEASVKAFAGLDAMLTAETVH
jgi:hypothetical protein